MLKNTLLLLLLVSSCYGFSQEIDTRLLAKYSKEELVSLQKNDPAEYTFLINALNKGVFISEIPTQKGKNIVFDGTLNIDPKGTYTFISLGKEITDRYQYYKIGGTTQMLAVQPRFSLDEREQKNVKVRTVKNTHKKTVKKQK
jgi:hypothetical protein